MRPVANRRNRNLGTRSTTPGPPPHPADGRPARPGGHQHLRGVVGAEHHGGRLARFRAIAAEAQLEPPRSVPQPQLVAGHDVPFALLRWTQEVVDAGGRRSWTVRRLDRQSARPGSAEPATLGVRGEVEPLGGRGALCHETPPVSGVTAARSKESIAKRTSPETIVAAVRPAPCSTSSGTASGPAGTSKNVRSASAPTAR